MMENEEDASSNATPKAESQHVKSELLSEGKWITLKEMTYKDPLGKERKWEAVSRISKSSSGTDAVVIIPILKRILKFDCVVLIKQYRPPLKTYTLEFPAGLIDKDENPMDCAVRELKEETGYVGVPKHASPGVCVEPGLCSSTVNMVTMEIDGDQKENRKPKQQQAEDTEFIEVITIVLDNLLETLNKYASEGVVIHSLVYTYAVACVQTAKPKQIIS